MRLKYPFAELLTFGICILVYIYLYIEGPLNTEQSAQAQHDRHHTKSRDLIQLVHIGWDHRRTLGLSLQKSAVVDTSKMFASVIKRQGVVNPLLSREVV